MRTKSKTSGYIIRSAAGILIVLALAIFSALIATPRAEESNPASSSPATASVDIGDVAVDIGYSTIKKLSAADGRVLWSVSLRTTVPLRSIHRTWVFIPDMAATATATPARFISTRPTDPWRGLTRSLWVDSAISIT